MSTLYIRIPSKAAADSAPHWIALPCAFAVASHGDAIEREGTASLSELADTAAKVQRVVLLVAASDVTLLRVHVPPMSAAKLKAALPNLVEDQLMSDPDECIVVPGATVDGLRTVAVMHRGWFEILVKTFTTFGARRLAAVPAQLCLPHQAGTVTAAVAEQEGEIDLTVRLAEQQGIGLPIVPEQPETAARDVVQTLTAIVPEAPITLYAPQAAVRAFQDTVNELLALDQRITVHADHWPRWITGANGAGLDLVAASGTGTGQAVNWRAWRWPAALAATALLVNIIGLNIEWWRMKREANALRAAMTQTYRAAYPRDTMIVDPLAQMRQKIAAARHGAGQAAPDDFTALAASFGEAWESVAGQGSTGIAAIEYRDRSLFVRLKPEAGISADQLKPALASRNLSLAQSAAGTWQIRSAK
ncbi:MAG TPA: type II secretion system protein GspL [Paucimonas sp.]|nr:type II secretion system protein GspL [Paucimonas sp.]